MKRLKYYLLQMENNNTTYREMYEGKVLVYSQDQLTHTDYDNTFYHGDVSFEITCTHKLAQDKPTLIYPHSDSEARICRHVCCRSGSLSACLRAVY